MTLALTPDQKRGKQQLVGFLANPAQSVLVIEGYSGTGKSTLLKDFLNDFHNIQKAIKLINPKYDKDYEVVVSATTNKAAESLAGIINTSVRTIYSVLGLRVRYDRSLGKKRLVQSDPTNRVENTLLFIDEASYADEVLLDFLFKITRNCKIVLMGDPAQLLNPGTDKAPAFNKGYPTVKLTDVVRQKANNKIQDLSTMFRDAVTTGIFTRIAPDGNDVIYLSRETFDQAIIREFTRPDWKQADSRILAWTNNKVERYNQGLRGLIHGNPEINKGDYLVCNSHVNVGRSHVRTDTLVCITDIKPADHHGFPGYHVVLQGYEATFFMPASLEVRKAALEKSVLMNDAELRLCIEDEWIDLRATFASTINKAQGSTYDKVFIDLDDVNRCTDARTIARLMYVGGSRARFQVYLTGLLT